MGQIIIRPQLQGILTKEAFQRSPQASALDSFNFWPIDAKTGRLVPGTRPKFQQLESATGIVTLLEGVNGKAGSNPFNSFVAGIAGQLYYWNGSGFTAATGAQAASIDTTRMVSAAPFVNQLVITRASNKPIIFDYPTGVATTVVESVGTAPSDARICVNWQGTVWLSGRLDDPHVLYAPRVGDLTDWDYSVDPLDQFGAFFTDSETEGKLSGPVTALMPQTSDTMIVSTYEGLLAMRGHPRQGGVFETINKGRFVLGQGAWCRVPGDTLLFLTPLGIMSLGPEPNATPALFSKTKMPEELISLPYTYSDPTVTMVYDNRWNQVHLFNRGTFEQGWTLDLETGGFHRIDAESYPYCVTAFPTFDSEQSSGTLFGRYDGIRYFDKFGEETFSAGFTLNPVPLSQSTMSKGHINAVRVILGRNSPSSDLTGAMRMALGIDSQDAVSKALAGNFDYEVDLQTLKNNNGMCYPKQSGQSVVFSFTHAGGDVSIEEIHMDVVEAGYNRGFRSEQFEADGEATNFSEGVTDLDTTAWQGYQAVTPQVAPASSLTDYTHFLDLSLLDSTWWSAVQIDGRDIRVSTAGDVQIPCDIINFDYAGQSGLLAFKASQTTTPVALRVWAGNPDAVPVPVANANGQYATYDNDWRAFYPDGATEDRTQFQNTMADLSGFWTGSPTSAVGPMGGLATDVSDVTSAVGYYRDTDFFTANSFDPDLGDDPLWTLIIAGKKDTAANISGLELFNVYHGSALTDLFSIGVSSTSGVPSCSARSLHTTLVQAVSGSAGSITEWNHFAGVWDYSVPNRTAYLNGVGGTTNADAIGATPSMAEIRTGFVKEWDGILAMAQVHTTTRSAAWIAFQAAMMDQATFWGSIPAFVQVNVPVPLTFNPVACPSGVVPVVETGTWSGYAAATPDNPASSLLNVLHLIDLDAMPASWWSAVASDGHDIRATNANNLFIPFDLVDFNYAAQTGFAVVKLNQYEQGANEIRLWVGNASAVTVSACSSYGRYATYDPNVKGFWPGGSGTDRTQWLNTTATQTPDSTGPVGNTATDYTGTISATADANIPETVPYTLIAAAKITSGTQFQDQTIFSLTSELTDAASILKTKASASPARYISRRPTGAEIVAGNNTVITAGNWWLQSAVVFGSTVRSVLVNGAGTSQATVESAQVEGLSRATIGGQKLPDGTELNMFDGEISLVQLHGVARPDDWVAYQYAMFNQSTFWNTWAWTASSSSLPQP